MDRKRYDSDFLLSLQFVSASMIKPKHLTNMADVVLDRVNKTPLPPAAAEDDNDEAATFDPDFAFSHFNSETDPSEEEPGKTPSSHKAENAWRPAAKESTHKDHDHEKAKTQELLRCVRCILNKLTPQKFQKLTEKMRELMMDTEERLKAAIHLIFEKAISEPHFSTTYAKMCHCLMELKVPSRASPGVHADFHKLLINHCQREFEKDKRDDETLKKQQRLLEACKNQDKRRHLEEELEEAGDKARRRSLGNVRFIGELFRMKMMKEPIMHECVKILLKQRDEESLECLCKLLSTIGKDLDQKAESRVDKYFHQIGKIVKERKTSSRIRFKLLDLVDLRRSRWVPRGGDQGPKTIQQIHQEAEMEEHREQIKVQQQLLFKKEEGGGRIWRDVWSRGPRASRDARRSLAEKPDNANVVKIAKIVAPDSNDPRVQVLRDKQKPDVWTKGTGAGSRDQDRRSSVRSESRSESASSTDSGGGNGDTGDHKREPLDPSREDRDGRESQKQEGRSQVSPEPGRHDVPQPQRQRRRRQRRRRQE